MVDHVEKAYEKISHSRKTHKAKKISIVNPLVLIPQVAQGYSKKKVFDKCHFFNIQELYWLRSDVCTSSDLNVPNLHYYISDHV